VVYPDRTDSSPTLEIAYRNLDGQFAGHLDRLPALATGTNFRAHKKPETSRPHQVCGEFQLSKVKLRIGASQAEHAMAKFARSCAQLQRGRCGGSGH
jgi:hypothetical protein